MLYLIGLGLSWKDLSLRALEALKTCDKVYLEAYTSVADFSPLKLSRLLGKKVFPLNRKQVEEEQDFLKEAESENVALLVFGDPLSATTHIEILRECEKQGVECKVVHAPSVFTAIAETGLSLYKFGKTASIPFWQPNFKPESFFDILEQNQKIGAHTLFLLDLNPAEKKFLTIPEALKLLLKTAKKRNSKVFTEETLCIGCARLGSDKKVIKVGKVKELLREEFGQPPYCLIVPSKLEEYEYELGSAGKNH